MSRREKVMLLLALGGVCALTYRTRQLMLATTDLQRREARRVLTDTTEGLQGVR